jgi:transketolase
LTTSTQISLDLLCINTIRTLSMDAVQKADSGHPGTPMALAPLGYLLFTRHLKHNPADPHWPDRDRFVLSAGHASMLLYSLLYLTGYDLSLDDIRNFRQWESKTPGHPEYSHTPGVETTTGPLGQGVGNAVGMALGEAHLAAAFNRGDRKIVDHRTWFIASDGDLMEGISHEAASFAGHLKLGKLIGFYDDNRITIDGTTDISYSDDAMARFQAYGWHVQRVDDANDLDQMDAAIEAAKADTDRPSLIIVRSHIGFGSPNKIDTPDAHGAPLGADEIRLTKEALGWPTTDAFHVPEEALTHCRTVVERGAELHGAWQERFDDYVRAHGKDADEFRRRLAGELPQDWEAALPVFNAQDGSIASRAASGKVLNALAARIPELVGGSADLAGSNNTTIKGSPAIAAGEYAGRNIHFGIREHAMGSVMNGVALHGGVIPFGGTFLIFSDYMRPAIRLASLMRQHVIYVFTHDSIGLGEDGPTHQPVEQLTALRVIPGLTVIRPADANETAEAWRSALKAKGPVALSLTRQKLPLIDRAKYSPAQGAAKGAYVLADAKQGAPRVIIISSGSEVSIALEAYEKLSAEGVAVRVVSMPSHELFASQSQSYQDEVLPRGTKRVAIEAAHPMSWYRWVGSDGRILGIDRFGASAPYERIYKELGLGVADVISAVRELAG